ncbi:hypothetical protein SSAG_05025 [Streptomyces sp. Mg1]|nr:hypothetical protein SSAG_05025 [Streptomyces sp. Mg1]
MSLLLLFATRVAPGGRARQRRDCHGSKGSRHAREDAAGEVRKRGLRSPG